MKIFVLAIVSVLFVSCASYQKDKQSASKAVTVTTKNASPANLESVTCEKGSDSRVIAVAASGSGCKLNYTKFGETSTPATSINGNAHCKTVQAQIVSKLSNAGYNCK